MFYDQSRCQTKHNFLRRSIVALVFATSFAMSATAPAQAWGPFGGLFSGKTQEGASGNSRGGATRDEFCEPDAPTTDAAIAQPKWQISALVPETNYKTMAATPSLFVYVQQTSASQSKAKLTPQLSGTKQLQGIELEDIKLDDLKQFDEETKVNLLLQLEVTQNNNSDVVHRYDFPLPRENTLLTLPLADGTSPLMAGQSYEWTLRLLCRQVTMNADQAGSVQISETEQSALFGQFTKIPDNPQIKTALASNDFEARYQAYLANELWFELVADLATMPTSTYWQELIELWQIPAGEAEPRVWLPLTEE